MEDLDNLNGQQRRILHQYQSITHNNDIEESVRILQENDWDIDNAVQNRYLPANSKKNKHATTAYANDEESPSSTSALLGNNSLPSASRRTSENKKKILSIFLWPFNLIWKISWSIIQLAVRLLHRPTIAAPRRDPRSEADRFLRDFESTYGTIHPDFFSEGGYTQALNTAKNELKYMLAILSSEEHDDHDKFYRETLTDSDLIDYLRQHQVIVWGGNVRYTEAFQVSNTLQATTYPFLAIIALQQPSNSSSSSSTAKMSVIDRIEGPTSASAIIRRLDSAIARIDPSLNRLRMEREQREMERRIREEQDRAYQESLRADQQKQQRLQEEQEAAARAEQERLDQAQNRDRYIQYLVQHLPKEETFGPDDKVTKISFRMANGDRVIRKFKGKDTIMSLYEFIEAYPHLNEHWDEEVDEIPHNYQHHFKFTIHSPFPRVEYLPDSAKQIMDEKGLWPSATLIVDTMDDEESDDD